MFKNCCKFILVGALLLAIGCTNEPGGTGKTRGELVSVKLNIHTSTFPGPQEGVDVITRATQPLDPEKVNLIKDIWVFQYASDGVLCSDVTKHYRVDAQGEIALPGGLENVILETGENTTVCLLANVGSDIESLIPNWPPDNLMLFNDTKIGMDIISFENTSASNDGKVGLLKNVYMFGYYQGEITETTTTLSAILGRLAVRMNLIIQNNTTTNYENININLQGIPKRMLISPINLHGLAEEDYADYVENVRFMSAGSTVERYYYFGGCYNPENKRPTILELSAGNGIKTIPITLGGDPAVPHEYRDYSMYRNTTYTYTINIQSSP